MTVKKIFFLILLSLTALRATLAQQMPDEAECMDYLITFGRQSKTSFGDDDFVQILFITVSETHKDPIYIRVFDPDLGGKNDDVKGEADSRTKFMVFGGKGAFSDPTSKDMEGNKPYTAGQLLYSRVFTNQPEHDNKWLPLGPFNPTDGEYDPNFKSYVFKVVVDGVSGNDGNCYKFFLSTSPVTNISVEGGNLFTYKYTIRMSGEKNRPAHIYPFIDKNVISLNVHNFDFDKEGEISLNSTARISEQVVTSGDNQWVISKFDIKPEEKNSTMDIRISMKQPKNNDFSLYVTNQYKEAVAFFSVPIGGPPKFKYKVSIKMN
jgi:hypothetical protein